MSLGSTLRERRETLGWSLRDVERKTNGGISNGYLSLLESDEVKQPSPRHLHLLAGVFEISYALLMKLAGYVVPNASEQSLSPGWAFAGLDDLTPEELSEVEELVKRQVRILRMARKSRSDG
jgi:transcriptional regulator with XRE-family HTH domain